jgi:hypothetical protein
MSFAQKRLALPPVPRHLRPRREKVFGPPQGIPLDRNAKARIMAYARGYNAKHRLDGQHWGPITRAFMGVLEALLYGFHNSRDGRCFPSYEAISGRANCSRATVYLAIIVLERIGLLSWVNRIYKERLPGPDLFGGTTYRWHVRRTSNAYVFRDPLPCADRPNDPHRSDAENPEKTSKSKNATGTLIPDLSLVKERPKIIVLDPESSLDRALIRLGRAAGAIA